MTTNTNIKTLEALVAYIDETTSHDTAAEDRNRALVSLITHCHNLAELVTTTQNLGTQSEQVVSLRNACRIRVRSLLQDRATTLGLKGEKRYIKTPLRQAWESVKAGESLALGLPLELETALPQILLAAMQLLQPEAGLEQHKSVWDFHIGHPNGFNLRVVRKDSKKAGVILPVEKMTKLILIAEKEQIIVLDKNAQPSKNGVVIDALLAHKAGVELAGLRANPAMCVVLDGPTGTVLKGIWNEGESAVTETLSKKGFGASLHAENHEKHGYVQKLDSYIRKANVFAAPDADGIVSAESVEKLIARLSKQVKGTTDDGTIPFTATTVVYALDSTKRGQYQAETVKAVEASGAIGSGGFNTHAWHQFGAVRCVGFAVLGQKVGLAYVEDVVDPLIREADVVAELLTMECDTNIVILPYTAVKAAASKASLPWQDATLTNGDVISVAIVRDADYRITESAACAVFELVPEESVGFESFCQVAVHRCTGLANKGSVTKRAFALSQQRGITLAESLLELVGAGEIRRKNVSVKTNVQMLQSISSNYGTDQAEAFVNAVLEGEKAGADVEQLQLAFKLLHPGTIDRKDIFDVNMEDMVNTLHEVRKEKNWLERDHGMTLHGEIVIAQLFQLGDAEWANLQFPDGTEMIFPGTKVLEKLVSVSNKGTLIKTQGLLAAILEAVWYTTTIDASGRTETVWGILKESILECRNSVLGKQLGQVHAHGSTGLIVSSWSLGYGEVASPVLDEQYHSACKSYSSGVGAVFAKPPTIMANAVRRVWVVRNKVQSSLDAILMGTAQLHNAMFVLHGQDDGDGDTGSVYLVPNKSILKDGLGKVVQQDAPLDESVNPVAQATIDFVKAELEGLWTPLVPKVVTHVLHTWEDITKAVVKAGLARGNVGLFTHAQQLTQSREDLARKVVKEVLLSGSYLPATMLMRVGIRKNVAGMAHVYDKLVKAVVRSLVNLQGGATQSDSMDRIKRAIGEMAAKMLAKVMSPQSCARIAPVYTEAEAKAWVQMYAWDSEELLANNAGALLTVIKQRQAKMLSEKVAEVVSLREAYQISFEKMFYSAELQKEYNVSAKGMDIIILTLMVHALAAVGHDAKVNVDAMELVFGNLNKVSKIGDVTELMSRPEVVVNQSIQAYLLNAAVAIKP